MNVHAPTGEDLNQVRAKAQEDIRNLRARIQKVGTDEMALLLTEARSHYAWTDQPVDDALLYEIYDMVKMGSTSMNGCPARFFFVKSEEGKQKLAKSLKPANVPKVLGAPVTVIIAYDTEFWQELPKLFPHEDRRPLFRDKPAYCEDTAYRNSTLQGAYLMIASRALGLDIGAMSGFSNEIVDEQFFSGTTLKSNFLCNIGYGDETALFQRLPRFEFDDVCKIM